MVFRSNLARLALRALLGAAAAVAGAAVYDALAGGSFAAALEAAFYVVGALSLVVAVYSFTGGASVLEDYLGVATYYRPPQPGDSGSVAELTAVGLLLIGAGAGVGFL
jgi:hypothetical protein